MKNKHKFFIFSEDQGERIYFRNIIDKFNCEIAQHLNAKKTGLSIGLISGPENLYIASNVDDSFCYECFYRLNLSMKHNFHYRNFATGNSRKNECLVNPFLSDIVDSLLLNFLTATGNENSCFSINLYNLEISIFNTLGVTKSCLCAEKNVGAEKYYDVRNALARRPLVDRKKHSSDIYREKNLDQFVPTLSTCNNPLDGVLNQAGRVDDTHALCLISSGFFFEKTMSIPESIGFSGIAETIAHSTIVSTIEGLERHAGILHRSTTPLVSASYRQIEQIAAPLINLGLSPDIISMFQQGSDKVFSWCPTYSALSGEGFLFPSEIVYYGKNKYFRNNSNGCASGSSIEEALLFALLELVERDAFMIHWRAKISPPRISIDTLNDLESFSILTRLRSSGAEVQLFDMRLDIPVPVILAVAICPGDEENFFALATGAHMNSTNAVRQALRELAMHLGGLRHRDLNENFYDNDFSAIKKIEDHRTFYGRYGALPFVDFLFSDKSDRKANDVFKNWNEAKPRTLSLLDDLNYIFKYLKAVGASDIFWCDQTTAIQKILKLNTVRAIVPGLLPLDFSHNGASSRNMSRAWTVARDLKIKGQQFGPADLNLLPIPYA